MQGSALEWQAVLSEAGASRRAGGSEHAELLGAIMPSADDGRLHALVAQLRAALRTAEISASDSQQQVGPCLHLGRDDLVKITGSTM